MESQIDAQRRAQRRRIRLILAALITLLALLQRVSAAGELPADADESVYAWAASYYAGLMARGEWRAIPHYTYNSEHPAFAKLLYAGGLRLAGHAGIPRQDASPPPPSFLRWGDPASTLGVYKIGRYISALFGTLQVLALSLANPVAGLLLAVHTMTVKYTAEMYLEAAPAFAMTLSILTYERSIHRKRTNGWFWLSAGLLGAAAASKYIYAIGGLVMSPFIVWQQRRRPWNIILYGLLALAVFFALDPILWPDPVGRLRESILFHSDYTQSAEVTRYAHPWWQPLDWMSGAAPWHPGVFWFPFDILTFLLGVTGLPFLFRQNKLYFTWFVAGWAFLFLWPTKWPQYTLTVIPAICLSAGALAQAIAHRYDLHLDSETWERIKFYLPDSTFWAKPSKALIITVVALVTLYGVGYAAYHINRAQQRRGWTSYTAASGQLTSDAVTALALDQAEQVWIGTRQGLTVYSNGGLTFYRSDNSGLTDDAITALALDQAGRMWIGTEQGIGVYGDEMWTTYTAQEMGLAETAVRALAPNHNGSMWAGTLSGAARWDGNAWQAFLPTEAGLTSDVILALTVGTDRRVWLGTDRGLAALELSSGEPAWTAYTAASSGLASDSIQALLADPRGGLWVGTDGGGLCRFQGEEWACYRTSNSDIPWNTIAALALDNQGHLWAATEMPTQIGGAVANFDGQRWLAYTPRNSGLTGSTVAAILQDQEGRYWFGTQSQGLSVWEGK